MTDKTIIVLITVTIICLTTAFIGYLLFRPADTTITYECADGTIVSRMNNKFLVDFNGKKTTISLDVGVFDIKSKFLVEDKLLQKAYESAQLLSIKHGYLLSLINSNPCDKSLRTSLSSMYGQQKIIDEAKEEIDSANSKTEVANLLLKIIDLQNDLANSLGSK